MDFFGKIRSKLDLAEVVCPNCNRDAVVDRSQLGTDIECGYCHDTFAAVEAVKCEKCGSFRHPGFPCGQCFPDNEAARKYREERRERRRQDLLDRLPELWDGMAERIEELEDRVSELGNRIEELERTIEELKPEEE